MDHHGEPNQVWTNLISNAIEAMYGKGGLRIRTLRELNCDPAEIIVQIAKSSRLVSKWSLNSFTGSS